MHITARASILLTVTLTLQGMVWGVSCRIVSTHYDIAAGKRVTMSNPDADHHDARSVVHCAALCTDDIDCVAAMFDHGSRKCATWNYAPGQKFTVDDQPLYTTITTSKLS